MAISLRLSGAQKSENVKKIWFFPKTRMRRALKNAGYSIAPAYCRSYNVNKMGGGTQLYDGWFDHNHYYPRFHTKDEELRQVVAPYVIFGD